MRHGDRRSDLRDASVEESDGLLPGDAHYRAYVGPPSWFDVASLNQMTLLTLLGLRDVHTVLDFGCGSLRLGRLLIPFLRAGGYYGIDPNAWLIEDALDRELGRDAVAVKRPHFNYSDGLRCDVFGEQFDFIVAQSIFSHTGLETSRRLLREFASVLKPDGIVVLNWRVADDDGSQLRSDDWLYPGLQLYSDSTIKRLAGEAGLVTRATQFYHPGDLTWYLAAHANGVLLHDSLVEGLAVSPVR